ncbi:hypothetical protein RQP46_008134 [Phenoliferia psychrophenolica]
MRNGRSPADIKQTRENYHNSTKEERRDHPTPHIFRVAKSGQRGELPMDNLVRFLAAYKAALDAPDAPATELSIKGRKRGELTHIRGLLRNEYPSFHINTNMIKLALSSRLNWAEWRNELACERVEKLAVRSESKKAKRKRRAARKAAREQQNK